MKISIIYNSYSGNTRTIGEEIKNACKGELIEVRSKNKYSKMMAYTLGCYRAAKEQCDPIEPETIDVSSFDCIVLGTPVWAGKATPAINGAVAALKGCEGKKAFIYATCGKTGEDALRILKTMLTARGITVTGEWEFKKADITKGQKIKAFISDINASGVV